MHIKINGYLKHNEPSLVRRSCLDDDEVVLIILK